MLRKTLSLNDADVKFAAAEGIFTGYGSVFGVIDAHNDLIMPGAYADVLSSGNPVDVYVNHDWLNGALPVGRWNGLSEDSRGLSGTAELVMQMRGGADAYWAMKRGLVNGLSVAIIPDSKSTERRADGVRVIHRIKALKEISIVTDPANAEARVTDIKFFDDAIESVEELQTIRDFERFLRDAGGLSKGLATALTSRAKLIFAPGDLEKDAMEAKAMADLAARIHAARIPL
jgi:HK97 family phage prohead protease